MKPRLNPLVIVSAATALAFASAAHAADITWDSPVNLTGDSDVFIVGSLHYGYTETTVGTSVNGVTFAAGNSATTLGGGNVTMSGFDGGVDPGSYNDGRFSGEYATLIQGGAWNNGSAATVNLNNLSTSHVYATQFWVADYRQWPNTNYNRSETLTGGANTSGSLTYLQVVNGVGNDTTGGSYVIGRFTADATSQAITVTPNSGGSAQMNAIQVRDITGVWNGAANTNLNSGAANFEGGSYTTISGLAAPVTSLYFADTDGFGNSMAAKNSITVDAAGFSAGSLNFQNNSVNYTLQNASGTTGITGATVLNKSGFGTLTLASANTHSGATSLNGGTLRLQNAAALGSGSLNMASGTTLQLRADSNATFSGGDNLGGLGGASITIDVNQLTSGNSDKTLSFATGGFNTYDTTINVTGGNGYTLALGGVNQGFGGALILNANSANLTIGDIGSNSAVSSLSVGGDSNTEIIGSINSTGGLTKSGDGTLTLSGASTYSGATSVSAGTLLVTGSLGNTAVSVDGGAFGGTGTVGGSLTINSGGFFHVANLADALDVSGTITLFSGFGVDDLAGLDWGSVVDGTYTLINGTLGTNVFTNLANNSLATAYDIDGLSGSRSAYFQAGSLQLVVIPEPGAALLGSLGMLTLLRRRR